MATEATGSVAIRGTRTCGGTHHVGPFAAAARRSRDHKTEGCLVQITHGVVADDKWRARHKALLTVYGRAEMSQLLIHHCDVVRHH